MQILRAGASDKVFALSQHDSAKSADEKVPSGECSSISERFGADAQIRFGKEHSFVLADSWYVANITTL